MVTTLSTSEDIKSGLDSHSFETLIQHNDAFYGGSDIYTALDMLPGGGFRAISHSVQPAWYSQSDSDLVRAFTKEECENFVNENIVSPTITYGTAFGSRVCTIVSGIYSFSGTASIATYGDAADTEAAGIALADLLNSANFEDVAI